MALLSATSPAKALFLCHEEPQHAHAVPAAAHPQQRCLGRRARARGRCAAAMRAPDAAIAQAPATGRKPRVLVAGGGIGGLVFALAARRKGYDVTVFERDLSAVRGEGQYRGPIQIQSNALAALEAIDMAVAEEVMRVGCVTGDRINGLVDGISGSWCVTPTVSLRAAYLHAFLLALLPVLARLGSIRGQAYCRRISLAVRKNAPVTSGTALANYNSVT
jgi:zeaxanthin epoxidase